MNAILEFLSLIGGYRASTESTLVKMSNFWKYNATARNIPADGGIRPVAIDFTVGIVTA